MRRQLIGLAVLQALDLATTFMGLGAGAIERNPAGAVLLNQGFMALVVAKIVGTAAVAVIAWWLWRSPATRWQAVVGLQVGCAMMIAVVGWNAWVLLLHGGVA